MILLKLKSATTLILFAILLAGTLIAPDTTNRISREPAEELPAAWEDHRLAQDLALEPASILVYTQFVDDRVGEEYHNTMTAINNTYGTNYYYTNLTDYTALDAQLPGNDILLIPEQENANVTFMKTVGATWGSTLSDFVENGGVIVLLDFGNETAPGLGLHIYNESSLMAFGPVLGQYPSAALTEMNRLTFGDALCRQVKYRWTPQTHTFAVATTDGTTAIADYDTDSPVCVHKIMGRGHVVFLGFDLSDPDPYYEQIVGNAVRLPNHVVFDYSQQSEYTWLNERADQYYNDDHPAIAFVEDLVEAGFAVSRMDTFNAAFLNASDVIVCPLPKQYIDDYDAGEIAVLDDYVANGGAIFIQSDWSTYGDDIRDLANNFGYDWARDDLWDTDDAMHWYYESQIAYTGDNILSHPITYNVSRVEFYASDGFTTLPANAERIIVTDWDRTSCWGEGGWWDNWLGADGITLMAVSHYGSGRVSVVLDSNFMDSITYPLDEDQDNDGVIDYLDSENEVLLLNTIHWLADDRPANDAPLLTGLTHTPASPSNGESVNITVVATDSDGLANITCHYRLDVGDWMNVSMTHEGGNLYSAEVGTFYDTDFQDYYIRAFDNSADQIESVTSVAHLNGINYLPTTPMLTDPGTTDDDGVFLLNWTACDDVDGYVDHYDIQMSDSSWFTTIMAEQSAPNDDYEMTVFDNDTYYFRVRAVDDNGTGGFWCFPQSIHVVITEDLVGPSITDISNTPVEPMQGDTVTISADIIDARGVKNATCYYAVNSGSWTSAIMSTSDGINFECEIGPFLVDDAVGFYIEAYDNSTNLNAEQSGVNSFYISNQPPTAPILIDPGTVSSVSYLTINWTTSIDHENALDHYELQMGATSDFSLLLGEWNETETDKDLTGLSNGVYYFRVRAVDDHGAASLWSNVESVEIILTTSTSTTTTTTTTSTTTSTTTTATSNGTTTASFYDPALHSLVLLIVTGGTMAVIVMIVWSYVRQRSRPGYQF